MTDYSNMTPEEESNLVPDWVTEIDGNWYHHDRTLCLLFRVDDLGNLDIFQDAIYFTPALVRDLIPALQFFAANGRLPRRVGE